MRKGDYGIARDRGILKIISVYVLKRNLRDVSCFVKHVH